MARQARVRSKTGIYHVMLRGIDKRDIFLDDEDKEKFIKVLIKAKESGKFKIYGYCLMNNHLQVGQGDVSSVLQYSLCYIKVG